jgi:hypothetical protein
MTRGEFLFPALIFAMTAILLLLGVFYYHYSTGVLAFPLGSGLVLCGFCIYAMMTALSGRVETVPVDPDDPQVPLSPVGLLWMFALLPCLYLFGFVFGSALYLLVCLRSNGFSWSISAGIALGGLVATWGLFIKIFGILLPLWPLWMS